MNDYIVEMDCHPRTQQVCDHHDCRMGHPVRFLVGEALAREEAILMCRHWGEHRPTMTEGIPVEV